MACSRAGGPGNLVMPAARVLKWGTVISAILVMLVITLLAS